MSKLKIPIPENIKEQWGKALYEAMHNTDLKAHLVFSRSRGYEVILQNCRPRLVMPQEKIDGALKEKNKVN